MTIDDFNATTDADLGVIDLDLLEQWSEVDHVVRSVDRQLECLRSILVAADPALAGGPLGDLVRDTAGYVANRVASWHEGTSPGPSGREWAWPADPEVAAPAAVLRSLLTISALAARALAPDAMAVLARRGDGAGGDGFAGGHPLSDIVESLVDEVTEQYRALASDITQGVGAGAAERRAGGARAAKSGAVRDTGFGSRPSSVAALVLYIDQLVGALGAPGQTIPAARAALRVVGGWLLIAAQVSEARAWVRSASISSMPSAPVGASVS